MNERDQPPRPRIPAMAARYYPAEAASLARRLDGLFAPTADGPDPGMEGPPWALIAPHAGLRYAGAVYAAAYGCLRKADRPAGAVLLGPRHRGPHQGVIAPTALAWRTPLGDVSVDRPRLERLERIARAHGLRFAWDDAAHAPEHSLEMQALFWQAALSTPGGPAPPPVAPLLVGAASAAAVGGLIDAVWSEAEQAPGTAPVVIVSTDLSHHLALPDARVKDQATEAAIEALEPEVLDPGAACGYSALAGLLWAARARRLRVRRLARIHSSDLDGDEDDVVGYGAWRLDA